ncbi:MAG TPA: hypothetical protein PLX06_12400 [Fimbriimonadaceae bacterium]|nr:hypothetical protein [Fimbriimonadaceae bacterium]
MLFGLLGWTLSLPQGQPAFDQRLVPPVERIFRSPDGKLTLKVRSDDNWKTREPIATLLRGEKVVAKTRIPHSHGPRDAGVTNDGYVVLFDEWINVKSTRAVSIYHPPFRLAHTFSFEDVAKVLNVEPKDLVRKAKKGAYRTGTWMQSKPKLVRDQFEVRSGDQILSVNLVEIALSCARSPEF